MTEAPNKLEKTYSRDRNYARDGLEHEATPVALVRSVTQRSRRMLDPCTLRFLSGYNHQTC